MILDKVLILKGLAGVTTIGSAVTIGVVGSKNGWWGSHQLTPKEIKTGLGLPSDCSLPKNIGDSEKTTCSNIDVAKLKAINFEGKGTTDPTIDNGGSSVTLKITKTNDNTTYPNGGYKFVFETTQNNITIPKTTSGESISIKKGTNTEFKIKKVDKKLTLEKAWNVSRLGEKVGLVCPDPNGEKKCTFNDGKINVNNGGDNSKITNGKLPTSADVSSKKMTYEEDQEGYNQGFKFYLDESNDITLTVNGGEGSSGEKKIIKKGSSGNETHYEIKEESGTWYLTKKATTGGSVS